MLRSLYSGVSGMKGFQTKMDVIANNIANTNTTAFKSGRVRFQDIISQTIANASAPNTQGLGGVNPQQVGLGMQVSAIDTIMTNGSLQPTNRNLDFGIEGEGFFVVASQVNTAGNPAGSVNYTRDGAFFIDHEGNLANSSGQRVLGVTANADGSANIPANMQSTQLIALKIPATKNGSTDPNAPLLESYSIDNSGKITAVYSDGDPVTIGYIVLSKFSNPAGLEKIGGNNYVETTNSGEPELGEASKGGRGSIRQGFLEMSNVDLANEFTEMIIASRAYSANSRSITTSDEMLQELINLKR